MKKPKQYSNDDITVMFEVDKCIHSEKCWRGLNSVFNPQAKPWVDMNGAANEAIIAQVKKCPSGALYMKNEDNNTGDMNIKAECMADGPLIVKGTIEVKLPDGTLETKEKMAAFCRCGASNNKPYCDGSHKEAGFTG